jgi:hypothetical protein
VACASVHLKTETTLFTLSFAHTEKVIKMRNLHKSSWGPDRLTVLGTEIRDQKVMMIAAEMPAPPREMRDGQGSQYPKLWSHVRIPPVSLTWAHWDAALPPGVMEELDSPGHFSILFSVLVLQFSQEGKFSSVGT